MDLRKLIAKMDKIESKQVLKETATKTSALVKEKEVVVESSKFGIKNSILLEFGLAEATAQELAQMNGIADPNKISVGQTIVLPGEQKYTIASGDTLGNIAAGKYRGPAPTAQKVVSRDQVGKATPVAPAAAPAAPQSSVSTEVAALAKANGIADPNKIQAGQELTLADGSKYTIARGDTLNGIAAGKYKGTAPTPVAQPDPQAQAAVDAQKARAAADAAEQPAQDWSNADGGNIGAEPPAAQAPTPAAQAAAPEKPVAGTQTVRDKTSVRVDRDNDMNADNADPYAQAFAAPDKKSAAKQLTGALKWFGTNEDQIFQTLSGLDSKADWYNLQADYFKDNGSDLLTDLKDDMGETEMTQYVWDPLSQLGVTPDNAETATSKDAKPKTKPMSAFQRAQQRRTGQAAAAPAHSYVSPNASDFN